MLPVISNKLELFDLIEKVGFIPLFKCCIEGFSVEELTSHLNWWGEDEEKDPWEWRKAAAASGNIAYGKFFNKKAGYISRGWFPAFAALRREGMDFESRYESGLSSYGQKRIMELLADGPMPSFELKRAAGFMKDGEKNFEGAITALQMQTYVLVRGFERKKNAFGREYGWGCAVYSTADMLFGEKHIESCLSPKDAKAMIEKRIIEFFPDVSMKQAEKLVR